MKRETKEYLNQIVTGTSMGLQWGLSVLIGLAIGVWLDSRFDTFPWLTLIFLVMGVIAGFRNYYRFIRQQQKEGQEEKKS
jgi:ATP synthase protein I